MEINSVALDIKALDSGKVTPDEVGTPDTPPPGVGIFLPHQFCLPAGHDIKMVTAHVTTPSGMKDNVKLEGIHHGHVNMIYQPWEEGLHILHVYYDEKQIPGSPYQFHANSHNSKYAHAFGPGLSHGKVNEPAEFTIVTKTFGAAGLTVAIEGPSKADIKCVDNEDGTVTVAYLPTKPGEYNVLIKLTDKNILGSPFTAKITEGNLPGDSQSSSSSDFYSLGVVEDDIHELLAKVISPSGDDQPCLLSKLPNGHLGFSVIPKEAGEHKINVYRNGKHIQGSPFKIYIKEDDLAKGHAGKVKVFGDGIKEGVTNIDNEFIVDMKDAGFGDLGIMIEGPRKSKVESECYDNEDGTCKVVYRPTKPGTFYISVLFGGDHIKGSPFQIEVEEPAEPQPERSFRSASKQGVDLWY